MNPDDARRVAVSGRDEATVRVNAALDQGEKPTDADLMICDTVALTRAALHERDANPLVITPGFAPKAGSYWMNAIIEEAKKRASS